MKPLNDSKPTVLARETLRQLASLRMPPTTDNYHKLYDQISGKSGDDVNSAVATTYQHKSADNPTAESISTWGETIEALLKQLEKKQGALTTAKKRESINRVLAKFSKDSNQLHNKLKALVDSWGALAVIMQESNEDGQL